MGGIHTFRKGTNRLYCFFGAGDLVKESRRFRTVERARQRHSCSRGIIKVSPCGSQNSNSSVLKLIVEKGWSSVYIHGLPKKSSEEAMRELVTEQLRESQCKKCPISYTSKVAVAACPEELPGQLKKLLTACELRKFFDKRAKVRKVYGSADLLLNPLFVQCPICATVV